MFAFTWILIGGMIAVNALYVAAEFAAVSVRHSKLHALAEEGHSLARNLLRRIGRPELLDQYVSCCQVGITLSSLVLGAVGQAFLAQQLTPVLGNLLQLEATTAFSASSIIVLLGLTISQMVLGELVPKSIALQFPTQTAIATVWPMIWSLWLLSWTVVLLNGSGMLFLRLVGVRAAGHHHVHSPDEIELLIVESRDGGLLEPHEQRRLHQALRLSRRPVSQLMVARLHMVTVDLDAPPQQVLDLTTKSPFSRFPVTRGSKDNIVGVIYTKDVIAHFIEHGQIPPVERIMRPVLTIPRVIAADRLLALFRERRCQQAILVDEYGGVEGLVTLEDVLTEVFGQVGDEFTPPEPPPEQLPDGRWRISGETRMVEVEAALNRKIGHDAATLGYLVAEQLGRFPLVGDRVLSDDLEIEVESIADRTITSLLVRVLEAESSEETT